MMTPGAGPGGLITAEVQILIGLVGQSGSSPEGVSHFLHELPGGNDE